MRKSLVLAIVCLAGLALGWVTVFAAGEDTETQTSTATLIVPHTAKLAITNANPSTTLTQDGTSEAAFDAGYIELQASYPTLGVTANRNWKLTAKVTTPFAAVDGYTKAVSDLLLKDAGTSHVTTSSFAALSDVTDLEVAASLVGVKDESHPCQYKILLDYTKDRPGTYTTTVTYTLTTVAA
jgi:hypothetical protein